MAEGSNVRLARCPNFDNLLPELLEYSVHQCSACATILRAKKREPGSDVVSEKSDEEKRLSESSAEKRSDPLNPTPGTKETEDSESESNWRRKDRAFTEEKASSSNRNFQRSEKEETSGISGEFEELKIERSVREMGYESVESHGRFRDSETEQWARKERSMRTRPRMDWTAVERGGPYNGNGLALERKIAPNFSYADVGPSNYDPNSFHRGSPRATNFPGGVEQLEWERAELLRKLDELKEQLNRSYPVPPDRPAVERESSDRPMPPRPYNVAAAQPPLVDRRNFYPPPPQYHYHPPHAPIEYHRTTRRYGSFDPDPLGPYSHEDYFHSPACSCLTCYDQSLWVPRFQVAHPNPNPNPNLYRHNDRVVIGPQQGYSSPRSRTRWPGELESEKRAVSASKKVGQHCLPFAGGAPFIACRNCFESLELPRGKLRLMNSHRQRLRCGACSAVISLQLENNRKLVVSDADDDVKGSPEISNDGNVVARSDSLNANCASSCSEEFNKNSSFNFCSAVTERSSLEEEAKRLSLDESESKKKKSKKVYSSSPSVSSSREELSFSSGVAREVEAHETAEYPVPPRSPMWQEPGSPKRAIIRDDGFDRVNYKEAEATELDVSFDEYQHMSQDFPESSREDYPLRAVSGGKGGSDSFLVGFIKKSLRDFSKSSHGSVESEKPKVFVNGTPLRDRLVKSAEMYAGPIRPGDYWYDYKAGFWGVMGQSCLGIIPPGIEEFNYPMPTNCGAGDTGVYVNGRELNQRDLDLLSNRGLPTARDRFYVVEINGKVFDEATGEFVHNLGKLAPTVERAKHGFGMKVPRSVQ